MFRVEAASLEEAVEKIFIKAPDMIGPPRIFQAVDGSYECQVVVKDEKQYWFICLFVLLLFLEVIEEMDIKTALSECKLKKIDIALRVGVTPQTIRFWELGLTEPSEENLAKLREVLENAKQTN